MSAPPIVTEQDIEFFKGEMTVAVSIEGRGIHHIKVGNITIIGKTGLFKVLYDNTKDKGEVVVKNGLIEVSSSSSSRPVNISGFYKVTFEGGVVSKPTQASVIQYDWK
jgi:hypothetical protein